MTDVVIVLGAAVVAPGVPSGALTRRTEHGAAVFFALGARHLLLSGGQNGHPPAEAVLMGEIARQCGVPEECIILEQQSRNTFENAVFSGRVIRERRWRRVVIVTDGYHLPRACYIFRRLGFRVDGIGAPRPAAMPRQRWLRQHLDEVLRFANCVRLFMIGAHKPALARVWGASGNDAHRAT